MMLPSLSASTAVVRILQPWLSLFYDYNAHRSTNTKTATTLSFELRHLHAFSTEGHIIFSDIPSTSDLSSNSLTTYSIKARPVRSHRPSSFEAFSSARLRSIDRRNSATLDWDEDDIIGPDVEDRETLLQLAKMSNNAYYRSNDDGEWYDLGGNWNATYPFGWEPDEDSLRGHVFATPDNATVVLSVKGTSTGLFSGGDSSTTKKDKLNDNLLFSCCCAKINWSWSPVCGCHRGGYQCDQDCLEQALMKDSLFYPIGTNLYNNLSYIYPDSNIWIIGHSLGGALASLLGATFGSPVVAFESPGEKMAASRLHLPSPPSTHHITHVYHTADPVPMGTCNGLLSSCSLAGFAMESRCHLGLSIVYDTVSNLSWSVDLRTHSISTVIENLLSLPWLPSEEIGRQVPKPQPEDDCIECYSWEFDSYTTLTLGL